MLNSKERTMENKRHTHREMTVSKYLMLGKSRAEIAEVLNADEGKAQNKNIFKRFINIFKKSDYNAQGDIY